MSIRPRLSVFIVAIPAVASCAAPEPPEEPTRQDRALVERSRLAETGQFLVSQPTSFAPASLLTATQMSEALDIPADMATTILAFTDPDPVVGEAVQVRPQFSVIQPRRGPSFLVMGTGRSAGNDLEQAEPGLDFPPAGMAGDIATLRFRINVPPHVNRLSFDYTFLSAEAPEYVASTYNDAFTAKITDVLGERIAATVSVSSSTFHPASETTVGETGFLLYAVDPTGVNTEFKGSKLDAGTTGWQHVNVPISPGNLASNPVTIELDIRDSGDGLLDSAVILDNFDFSAIEKVDPNTGNVDEDLLDSSGRIYRDPQLIYQQGKNVHSVVADGVTQILLRSRMAVAGKATFSLPALDFPTQGRLSANEEVLSWANSVTVDTVQVGTDHYAFAIYQSPDDFNVLHVDEDDTAPVRTVKLTMSFTPISGPGGFPAQPVSLNVVRPPVLIVPDMWANCDNWFGGLSIGEPVADPFDLRSALRVTCANYERTSSHGFALNKDVVPDYIFEALTPMRLEGIAGTQVEVIGHGVGGLLVRKHIDSDEYLRPETFLEGDVNRVITMHTPHLGSRMADEIVRFRDFLRATATDGEWNNTMEMLHAAGIRLDNELGDRMIDEVRSESPEINSIGQNGPRNVPYHVIYSTKGRSIARDRAYELGLKLMPLFILMERQHPEVKPLSDEEKERLIFGSPSLIFCADLPDPLPVPPPPDTAWDDHDLLLTMWEQQGGITAVTEFETTYPEPDEDSFYGHHEAVSNHVHHTIRLMELLNTPISDPSFTTDIPSPADVNRINNCPIVLPFGQMAPTQLQAPSLIAPGTITLVLSPSDLNVDPGEEVTIGVQAAGAQPVAVLFVGPKSSAFSREFPFKADLKIPPSAIGTVTIRAIAFYTQGGMAFAPPVQLNVQVTASLTSLQVLDGDVFLQRPGKTRQLKILGTYSDDIQRDLTTAALGTEYTISSLTSVATISPDGLITAIGPGNATIAIRNGDVIMSINLNVGESRCGDGVLDPGEECDDGNQNSGDGCTSACISEIAPNAPPSAVCQSPTSCNDPGNCSASVTNLGGGSSDPDGDPLSITQSPAGPYAVGEHTVGVNVSDGSLSAQCISQLEVLDCEAPALDCPADFVAECTAAGGALVVPPAADAADNCSVAVNAPAGGHLPLGSHQLGYTASDPSGNGASCTTTVTVEDTTPPSITCPSPSVAECTGNGQASVDPGPGSASDACTTADVSSPGVGTYPLGTTAVTFAASDLSGNASTCQTSVTVQDTIAPSVTCPSAAVAECTANGQATVDPGDATAADSCTTAAVTDPGPGSYPVGTTAVLFTATDDSGNQASCVTAVTVQDTTVPELACPSPSLAECTGNGQAVVDPGKASASDACGGSAVNDPGPSSYPLGTTAVTYTAQDDAGNQTSCSTSVTVQDTLAPSVTCPADTVAECSVNGQATIDPGDATVTDSCTTAAVTDPGPGSYPLGTTAVTYTATDDAGNQASCVAAVTVQDTGLPELACPAPSVAECTGNSQAVVDPGDATTSDACGGSVVNDPGPSSYPLGTTAVTYTAQDDAGNQTSCSSSVTVQDTTAPSVTCPPAAVAECTANGQATVDPGDATAADSCAAVSVTDPGPGNYPVGTTPVVFTATDSSGNQASCVSAVTVQDSTAPLLTCPAPVVAECTSNGQAVVDPGDATTVDACGGTTVNDPGSSSYPLGTTAVTYTAQDGAGNQTSCSSSVTVQDTTAPSIACPAPIVAECQGPSGAFVQPGPAMSSDVCTAVTVAGPSPGIYPPGTTVVTYTSQDTAGHQASCTSTIQVVDTTGPEIGVTPPDPLWPANHQYRTISLDDCNIVVEDSCGGKLPPSSYQAAITCVSSDEPDNAPGGGDGNTADDIIIVDSTTVRLRAERDHALDGRVYQIHFRVQDQAGNYRDGVCPVAVPEDPCKKPRKGDSSPPECPAVDSGDDHSVCR